MRKPSRTRLRIPGEFWKPQPAKLDRLKLLAMLKAGQDMPGAGLGWRRCAEPTPKLGRSMRGA
jgi:hypothetical protein